jgi:hypothetical protein
MFWAGNGESGVFVKAPVEVFSEYAHTSLDTPLDSYRKV